MRITGIAVIVSAAIFSVALSSCKNTMTPGLDQVVFPDTGTVNYNNYVQRLFNVACNYSGCHDAADQEGGLDLTNYFSMINSIPSPVIPRDSTSSILIERVKGLLQPQMPPNGPLNSNQIHGLARWVQQGAQDN
jgi:hypothetical protein